MKGCWVWTKAFVCTYWVAPVIFVLEFIVWLLHLLICICWMVPVSLEWGPLAYGDWSSWFVLELRSQIFYWGFFWHLSSSGRLVYDFLFCCVFLWFGYQDDAGFMWECACTHMWRPEDNFRGRLFPSTWCMSAIQLSFWAWKKTPNKIWMQAEVPIISGKVNFKPKLEDIKLVEK